MIPWNQIDTVLLDMDGTLLDLHYDNHFWLSHLPGHIARERGLDAPEAVALIDAMSTETRGSLDWYCLDHWTRRLGLDVPALKREIAHMVRVRPHTLALLEALQGSNRTVALVTNAHPETFAIKMERVDLRRWFDDIVISHELRTPKEDPRFWELLHQRLPYDPARTLLVDDTETVLDAARAHGIAHLLTLLQPDSQRQARMDTRFPGIHHFDEIMPVPALAS